ncbi:MAG: 3'-5' exonuclease [Cellvibrionaceae bacterium]
MILSFQRTYYLLREKLLFKNTSSIKTLINLWASNHFAGNQLCSNTEFLVVDTETSSLNPDDGELLSIGWIVIGNNKILLDTAEHHIVRAKESVGQSATIHHLRDCDLEEGISEEELLKMLLNAAKNRILVFHHAGLDVGFINKICLKIFKIPLLLPFLDTIQIEKKKLEHQHNMMGQHSLTLSNCRRRYHLPDYQAHNALIDALSTAELLLAQISHKGKSIKLRELKT